MVSVPEHRISQQPPLSVPPIITGRLQCRKYTGLVASASLIGGMPVFFYLFARVGKFLFRLKFRSIYYANELAAFNKF